MSVLVGSWISICRFPVGLLTGIFVSGSSMRRRFLFRGVGLKIFERIHMVDVTEYLGLVHKIVHGIKHHAFGYDELYVIGCLGLVKAGLKFDPSKGFKFTTFAYPFIRGAIYDEMRVWAKDFNLRQTGAVDVTEFPIENLCEFERTPDGGLEDSEQVGEIKTAIDGLPDRMRKAIIMYFYHGITMKHIAVVLGLSEPRISQLISLAKKKLELALAGTQGNF